MDARFYFIFAKQVLYKGLTIKLVNPGLFLYYFTQNFTITIGFTWSQCLKQVSAQNVTTLPTLK